jgi:hypothetical protein
MVQAWFGVFVFFLNVDWTNTYQLSDQITTITTKYKIGTAACCKLNSLPTLRHTIRRHHQLLGVTRTMHKQGAPSKGLVSPVTGHTELCLV